MFYAGKFFLPRSIKYIERHIIWQIGRLRDIRHRMTHNRNANNRECLIIGRPTHRERGQLMYIFHVVEAAASATCHEVTFDNNVNSRHHSFHTCRSPFSYG